MLALVLHCADSSCLVGSRRGPGTCALISHRSTIVPHSHQSRHPFPLLFSRDSLVASPASSAIDSLRIIHCRANHSHKRQSYQASKSLGVTSHWCHVNSGHSRDPAVHSPPAETGRSKVEGHQRDNEVVPWSTCGITIPEIPRLVEVSPGPRLAEYSQPFLMFISIQASRKLNKCRLTSPH